MLASIAIRTRYWTMRQDAAMLFRRFSASTTAPILPGNGIIEVREYTMKPEGYTDFLKLTSAAGGLRKQLLPLLGMFTSDIGGSLHRVVHFYHYEDYDHRDKVRTQAGANPEWAKYVKESRPHVQYQENKILQEAAPVYNALDIPSAASFKAPLGLETKVMYELRTYQLHPGYGSVPKLLEAFMRGLPDKVASDSEGQLVLLGYTDVGTLNNVQELWRYPSAQACIRARQVARTVPGWRDTIATVTPLVQTFNTSFLHPTAISPWQ